MSGTVTMRYNKNRSWVLYRQTFTRTETYFVYSDMYVGLKGGGRRRLNQKREIVTYWKEIYWDDRSGWDGGNNE